MARIEGTWKDCKYAQRHRLDQIVVYLFSPQPLDTPTKVNTNMVFTNKYEPNFQGFPSLVPNTDRLAQESAMIK